MKRLRYVTYTGLLLLLSGFVVYILVDSHSLPPIAGGSHKVSILVLMMLRKY